MFFFKSYYQTIIKRDLTNAFFYQDIKQIPQMKKIVLNFGLKAPNFKQLLSSLLALEIISSKKSVLTKSKHVNIMLKIKKGNPVGCKVILKKSLMYSFYLTLIVFIFPKIKQFQINSDQTSFKSKNAISIKLQNSLLFSELESHYQFFKSTPSLNITLVTNSQSQKELFFLLKSVKFFV